MFQRWWRKPLFFEPYPAVVGRETLVVAYHPEVRAIGQRVMDSGGNAFDAFVAAVAAECVLAEGATSLAGSLGALMFVASRREAVYLDAEFNDPLDPQWRSKLRLPRGASVLVPGTPAALEAITTQYGSRPLRELLEPAIQLAHEGFRVNRLMSVSTAVRSRVLKRSAHGRSTYLRKHNRRLAEGSWLKLPEVSSFLTRLGSEGASYVYSGEWGRRFLSAVAEEGGVLSSEDLLHYRVQWLPPWFAQYRGSTICSCSGRSYGGLWGLLALKSLEQAGAVFTTHYSKDADALEMMVRIAHQVWSEGWLLNRAVLDDPEAVEMHLASTHAQSVWQRALQRERFQGIGGSGAHSYPLITADAAGNVVCGTTTMESEPWGEGLFVEGLPLTSAGAIPWSTAPGQRRLSPFSMHLVLAGDGVRHAVAGISNSAVEFAFQLLVNLTDYGLPVEQAVSVPRFGTFPGRRLPQENRNWLDPRIDWDLVRTLRRRRLKFKRTGVIDTGLGAVMSVQPGQLEGATAPLLHLAAPF